MLYHETANEVQVMGSVTFVKEQNKKIMILLVGKGAFHCQNGLKPMVK